MSSEFKSGRPDYVAVASHSRCVRDEQSKGPTSSLFRAGGFALIESFLALSRTSEALLGQFARLNWPQPIDKLAISVIDEPTAAAYHSCNLVRQSQVMSRETKQPGTRQRVIAALSQIIGLPLTAARRAADMRTFHFGKLRPVDLGSVGDFALHVQCPWRIEGPDGIVTGRLDLWEPIEDNAPFDENGDYEKSPNLQDARLEKWLAQNEPSLIVRRVDADEFGGAAISLGGDFVLRLFPAGTRSEDWRLFRPKTDIPHLVVTGGAVEPDDEPGA